MRSSTRRVVAEFRYFAQPHDVTASTWKETPAPCDLCGEGRPGYDGPYYGEDDSVEFVCEECLIAGRLAERDLSTNEGEHGPPADRRAELEQRTPHLVTWQDFFWPVHCGDYCRFVRNVGERELVELSPDGDAVAYANEHLSDDLKEFPLDADSLPPRAPTAEDWWDVGLYLFECLECGRHVVHWDAS
jgi:hypothetical protein